MPAAGWLNKSSCLASALGVTKFITVIPMILVTLYCAIKSDLDVQQTHLCILQYGMHDFDATAYHAKFIGLRPYMCA
jgi:hypothetical protein